MYIIGITLYSRILKRLVIKSSGRAVKSHESRMSHYAHSVKWKPSKSYLNDAAILYNASNLYWLILKMIVLGSHWDVPRNN